MYARTWMFVASAQLRSINKSDKVKIEEMSIEPK